MEISSCLEIHFRIAEGQAVPISDLEAQQIADDGPKSQATISHVDEATHEIFFEPQGWLR